MRQPIKSFAELIAASDGPIVVPSAHDALSARLIERFGFAAVSVSGSSLLAARLALPDVGIAGLGEMAAGVSDILSATRLPALVDGDDGYGDEAAVARTVATYTRLGVSALTIEDQARSVKRPGQGSAVGLVDSGTMIAKIKAAVSARESNAFWIVGRTDAYALVGLEEAVARAQAMRDAGADALFVAGIKNAGEFEKVARRLAPTPLVAVDYGGAGWTMPSMRDLAELGFRLVVHPLLLLPAATAAMAERLGALAADTLRSDQLSDLPTAGPELIKCVVADNPTILAYPGK